MAIPKPFLTVCLIVAAGGNDSDRVIAMPPRRLAGQCALDPYRSGDRGGWTGRGILLRQIRHRPGRHRSARFWSVLVGPPAKALPVP